MFSKTYFVDNIPGSLSNIYEIKILICCALKETKKPLTKNHLNYVFQLNETVNYFNFCHALKELIDSHHIIEKMDENNHMSYLHLTKLGKEAAIVLKENVSKSVVEKTLKEIDNLLKMEHQNKNRTLKIEEQNDGYMAKLILKETGSNLLGLEIFCPTKQHAEQIKKEMETKTTEIFECVLAILENEPERIRKVAKKIEDKKF